MDTSYDKNPTPESPESPKPKTTQWYRAAEMGVKPHELLDRIVKDISDDQNGRYIAYKEYEKLLGCTSLDAGDQSLHAIVSDELSQNELQNTIETLWAQIFKNRVVPAISASEADFDEWDRARGLSRWLEGIFDETGVYKEVFPHAGSMFLLHGTGFIRVGWKEDFYDSDEEEDEESPDSEPMSERAPKSKKKKKYAKIYSWSVSPKYVYVDRIESKHGKPRSIYFKDHVDRFVLFDTYKSDEECFFGTPEERCTGIWKATANDDPEAYGSGTDKCDMITVWEAYHLPSSPRAKDGRHVIWINGCTLLDEEFTWDRFPLVKMKFGQPNEGYYGESCVKRLAPTQKNLDKLNRKIDSSQDVMGVPRIVVGNNGNGVKLAHIDDIPGGIIVCENVSQVKDWNAQCASQELYNDRDNAPRKMRSLLGISDFEAQQQIPQGMRDVSGAMIERWVDQGAARHAMDHAQYENAVEDLADLYIRQAEELQKMGYEITTSAPIAADTKTTIELLDFSQVCVDRRRFKIRVQSMSSLPQTFAGKVDAIEKLKNAGNPLPPKTAMRMLEIPDPNGANDILASSEEIIFKNLTYMTKTGRFLSPMPFDDLALIIRMTTDYINWYRIKPNCDYQIVSVLAQYIDEAVALQKGPGGADPNAPPTTTLAALTGGGMPGPGMPPGGAPMDPNMVPPPIPPGMPQPEPIPMPPGPPMGPM